MGSSCSTQASTATNPFPQQQQEQQHRERRPPAIHDGEGTDYRTLESTPSSPTGINNNSSLRGRSAAESVTSSSSRTSGGQRRAHRFRSITIEASDLLPPSSSGPNSEPSATNSASPLSHQRSSNSRDPSEEQHLLLSTSGRSGGVGGRSVSSSSPGSLSGGRRSLPGVGGESTVGATSSSLGATISDSSNRKRSTGSRFKVVASRGSLDTLDEHNESTSPLPVLPHPHRPQDLHRSPLLPLSSSSSGFNSRLQGNSSLGNMSGSPITMLRSGRRFGPQFEPSTHHNKETMASQRASRRLAPLPTAQEQSHVAQEVSKHMDKLGNIDDLYAGIPFTQSVAEESLSGSPGKFLSHHHHRSADSQSSASAEHLVLPPPRIPSFGEHHAFTDAQDKRKPLKIGVSSPGSKMQEKKAYHHFDSDDDTEVSLASSQLVGEASTAQKQSNDNDHHQEGSRNSHRVPLRRLSGEAHPVAQPIRRKLSGEHDVDHLTATLPPEASAHIRGGLGDSSVSQNDPTVLVHHPKPLRHSNSGSSSSGGGGSCTSATLIPSLNMAPTNSVAQQQDALRASSSRLLNSESEGSLLLQPGQPGWSHLSPVTNNLALTECQRTIAASQKEEEAPHAHSELDEVPTLVSVSSSNSTSATTSSSDDPTSSMPNTSSLFPVVTSSLASVTVVAAAPPPAASARTHAVVVRLPDESDPSSTPQSVSLGRGKKVISNNFSGSSALLNHHVGGHHNDNDCPTPTIRIEEKHSDSKSGDEDVALASAATAATTVPPVPPLVSKPSAPDDDEESLHSGAQSPLVYTFAGGASGRGRRQHHQTTTSDDSPLSTLLAGVHSPPPSFRLKRSLSANNLQAAFSLSGSSRSRSIHQGSPRGLVARSPSGVKYSAAASPVGSSNHLLPLPHSSGTNFKGANGSFCGAYASPGSISARSCVSTPSVNGAGCLSQPSSPCSTPFAAQVPTPTRARHGTIPPSAVPTLNTNHWHGFGDMVAVTNTGSPTTRSPISSRCPSFASGVAAVPSTTGDHSSGGGGGGRTRCFSVTSCTSGTGSATSPHNLPTLNSGFFAPTQPTGNTSSRSHSPHPTMSFIRDHPSAFHSGIGAHATEVVSPECTSIHGDVEEDHQEDRESNVPSRCASVISAPEPTSINMGSNNASSSGTTVQNSSFSKNARRLSTSGVSIASVASRVSPKAMGATPQRHSSSSGSNPNVSLPPVNITNNTLRSGSDESNQFGDDGILNKNELVAVPSYHSGSSQVDLRSGSLSARSYGGSGGGGGTAPASLKGSSVNGLPKMASVASLMAGHSGGGFDDGDQDVSFMRQDMDNQASSPVEAQ